MCHACHTAPVSLSQDWTNATDAARATPVTRATGATGATQLPGASAPGHLLGHVLRPAEFLRHARYDHAEPAPSLRRWIDRYWSVTWCLDDGWTHNVTTLDEPAVHLTREWGGVRREGAEGEGAWLTGPVTRGRFAVTQSGSGGVVGVRFRLGGITAFTSRAANTHRATSARPDLAALRDRTVRAEAWFAADLVPAGLPDTATAAAAILDQRLLSLTPQDDPGYAAFLALLNLLEDPAVTGTSELQRRSGLSVRALQRRFHHFVGVGPKRMILRSRVMDAVAALDSDDPRPIAALAQDLGWFDQSHFIRDFHAITGSTPAHYAAPGPAILAP